MHAGMPDNPMTAQSKKLEVSEQAGRGGVSVSDAA
jgi:hypothetical protein